MGKSTTERPDRLAYRVSEVANALGLSERAIRQILPSIPHFRIGTAIVIPIDALRKWLNDQAQVEKSLVDAVVDEVLSELE